MAQTITEEQKQLLQRTEFMGGTNAWEYVQSQNEADRPWVAAGILSLLKKGLPLNRLTVFWAAEDLRNPPKKDERPLGQYAPSKELKEMLTEEQREQLMVTTLENDMNAWDYVLSWHDDDQYLVALGILSCVKHGYELNRLTICWEARDLRYKT